MLGGRQKNICGDSVPFRDADELLLARGKKYRLEVMNQVLVRLKVEHSRFGMMNNQSFSSNFFEEDGHFRCRDEGDGQEGERNLCIPRHLGQ